MKYESPHPASRIPASRIPLPRHSCPMPRHFDSPNMYILINGAFGIGKTTVARELRSRLLRAILFDPELIGIILQRIPGAPRSDFQHFAKWRWLTVVVARLLGRFTKTVIIPMAFTDTGYLDEIRNGLARSGRPVLHFCLTAPLPIVRQRLAQRGEPLEDSRWSWVHRRAAECCEAHRHPDFALQIDTEKLSADEVAGAIVRLVLARC